MSLIKVNYTVEEDKGNIYCTHITAPNTTVYDVTYYVMHRIVSAIFVSIKPKFDKHKSEQCKYNLLIIRW